MERPSTTYTVFFKVFLCVIYSGYVASVLAEVFWLKFAELLLELQFDSMRQRLSLIYLLLTLVVSPCAPTSALGYRAAAERVTALVCSGFNVARSHEQNHTHFRYWRRGRRYFYRDDGDKADILDKSGLPRWWYTYGCHA